MRQAVISAPDAAAAGVAARSFHVMSPSNALNTVVQINTGTDSVAHPKPASSTSVPANGSTASKISFDCQGSLSWATLHRIR